MAGDSAANNAVEFEARRKEDSSWHPCKVSLCPNGVGLILDYGNNDFEDIIVNKDEALTRLRLRSVPLHGDDCSNIQQGDYVLATQQSQCKSLFFDAEVEKAPKVSHSKRVRCRCTFTIKWLHQEFKESLDVSSASIMRLATGDITDDPIIFAFMDTVKTLSCCSLSPLSTVGKDMADDMDIHDFLGKQIENISNSADYLSKKEISEDYILLEGEVAAKGQVLCKTVTDQNQMMRWSTQSWNKLQNEIEVEDPRQAGRSISKVLTESRYPVNPLAARAALASLMCSKLFQNREFPIDHENTGKNFSKSAEITTNKDATLEASNLNKSCISSVVSNNSTCSTTQRAISQPTKSTRQTRSATQRSIAISDENTDRKTGVSESKLRSTRSTRSKVQEAVEKNIPDRYTESDSSEQIVKYHESCVLKELSKVSSQLDDGVNLVHNEESENLTKRKTSVVEENNSNTKRVTRSAGHVKPGNEITVVKPIQEENDFFEHVNTDVSQGYTDIDSNVLETEELAEGTQERKKSNDTTSPIKTRENAVSNGQSSRGKKKSSSTGKQLLRSSPRFLRRPRTRSQNKS